MKKTIYFIFTVLLISNIQAQTVKVPTKANTNAAQTDLNPESALSANQADIGNLIGQLTNNISDEAFTDSFKKNKSGFMSSLNNVKDAAGASNALQTLQGGLLQSAMDSGWGKVKDKWIKDTKGASSIKSVASAASTLESNINDKFFKGNWAKARPAWQAGMNTLSK
jgi:hypothetical protein